MNKGLWILIALFAGLGSVGAWILTSGGRNTTLRGGDWEFSVADTAAISKIFIADAQGKTSLLERKNGYWTVNEKHIARKDAILNLLQTIKNVEISYRLPRAAVANVVRDISINKIKVEIYAGAKKEKSYYVGGTNQDETGVYMILADANEPYVCSLPQWSGNIRVRYIADEIVWRDRTIFGESVENIRSVSIDYARQQNKSFKLTGSGGVYEIVPFYAISNPPPRRIQKGVAEAFLTGFRNQIAEGFENDCPQRDSIERTTPFASISLTNMQGIEKKVRLFPVTPAFASGEARVDAGGKARFERYYAWTADNDFMMVQHINFQRILWPYQAFFSR